MKKRKTYEVSVINKTYSKTYSDETKFYTSDTALELNFQLKEVEYDFDSAEIILLNVDDRSLVTRPISKSAEGFTYELEDDILEHYGEWKGQLKFNEGGEIYVSSPVVFRIENDLNNDRPPKLTEVNTWKNLREIADGLIADIRNELESAVEQLSEIESAESERQSAEVIRVENENQRKTDHANRSAELAGKADKVVINNLLPNGFFSDGINGWSNVAKRFSIVGYKDGGVTLRTDVDKARLQYTLGANDTDIYYFSVEVESDNPGAYLASQAYRLVIYDNPPERQKLSYLGVVPQIHFSLGSNNVGAITTFYKAMAMNLTETFGAGNEPTKGEMDKLIKITGYIDGGYALNNKEMLIWTLELIRRNKNAIVALGGA